MHASRPSAALLCNPEFVESGPQCERLVIRGGHDDREERLARGVQLVKMRQRPVEEILVTDTPDVIESHAVDRVSVEHFEAIAAEKVIHVVEVPVAAVKKARVISERTHDGAPGRDAFVAWSAQN